MNKYDKIIYDRFMADHPIRGYLAGMSSTEMEGVYDVIEYFYKGVEPANDYLNALTEVNKINMLRHSTKGNIWRSVQSTHDLIRFVKQSSSRFDRNTSESEEDYKASIQNMYTSDAFDDHLEQSQDIQDKTDLLLYSPQGQGSVHVPSEEEIKFRNWLMQRSVHSRELRKILDMFGLFLAHANELKRQKYIPSVANIADIKKGNDLGKLIPDEMLALGVEEMEILFYYNLATENLLQYECREEQNVGKGDMVFLLDISESMLEPISKTDARYSRMNVALGFLLAMIKILQEQGRSCKLFSYNTMCMEVFDTKQISMQNAFRIVLNIHASGGTRIASAFKSVFDSCEDDVVIVTDGIDGSFNPASLDKGKRRVSCLLISEYSPTDLSIKRFVDSFILAKGVDDFKHLTEEFF